MKRSVELHHHARFELVEATKEYTKESKTVGVRFLRQVRLAIRNARTAPLRYPIIIDDYRRVVLAKFPYIVVYRLAGTVVHVVAVAHGKREPGYWFGR